MEVVKDRDGQYFLLGIIHIDDAYFGRGQWRQGWLGGGREQDAAGRDFGNE